MSNSEANSPTGTGFTYVFEGDDVANRFIIGTVLVGTSFLIFPLILLFGYLWRIPQSLDQETPPPAFQSWETLFTDGIRALAVPIGFYIFGSLFAALGLALLEAVGASGMVENSPAWVLPFVLGSAFIVLWTLWAIPAAFVHAARNNEIRAALSWEPFRLTLQIRYILIWILVGGALMMVSLVIVPLWLIPPVGFIGSAVLGFYALVSTTAAFAIVCLG